MARFSSMEDYARTLEKTVGVLDITGRKLQGVSFDVLNLNKTVNTAQQSFAKIIYEINASSKALDRMKLSWQVMVGGAQEIVKSRNEMRDFKAMMDRMEVSAKALSIALSFRDIGGGIRRLDAPRIMQGITEISKLAGETQTKVQGAFAGIARAISGSEVTVGKFSETLLKFNRSVIDISRISTTLGRSGVFSENFWRGVDKNTTLGRLSFAELYKDVLEQSKGLPMTERQFASLAETIGQKFGGSVTTAQDRLRRFLSLQNILPDMAERLEALKIGGEKGLEPRGLRETIALLGSLGADKKSIQTLAMLSTGVTTSEKSLMRFENAMAKRNQAAQNFNVKTAQSMEEGMIKMETVMANLTNDVTKLATMFDKLNGYIFIGSKLLGAFAASAGTLSVITRVFTVASGAGADKMGKLAGAKNAAGTIFGTGGATASTVAGASRFAKGVPLAGAAMLATGAIIKGAEYWGAASREREEEKKIENIGRYGEQAGEKDTASREQELLKARREKSIKGREAVWGAGGAIAGGVIGTFLGGPAGTMAGAAIGGMVGGMAGGVGKEKREQTYQVQNELQATLKDFGGDQTAQLVGGVDGVKTVEDALVQVNNIKDTESKKLAILSLQRGLNLTNVELIAKANENGNQELIIAVKESIELKKQNQLEQDKKTTALENYETMQSSLTTLKIIVDKSKEWQSAMKGQGDMFKDMGLAGPMITKAYTSARQAAESQLDAINQKQQATIKMWEKIKDTPDTLKVADIVTKDLSVRLNLKDEDKNNFEKKMKRLTEIGQESLSIKGDGSQPLNVEQSTKLSALDKERVEIEKEAMLIVDKQGSAYAYIKTEVAGLTGYVKTFKLDVLETSKNAALATSEFEKQGILVEKTKAMMSQYTGSNEANVNLLQKQNTLASAHADLIEKLALGMAPSYAARKRVYDLTVAERRQEEMKVEHTKKMAQTEGFEARGGGTKTLQQMGVAGEDVRKALEGNMDSLARAKQILESTGEVDAATQLQTIYNGILDTNVKIYGLKGKELEQTMKIREGYMDVLDEMTTGAGIVAGLIPDMNRGIMSVMDVQRMMTGADFGGAMKTGFSSMKGFGQAGAAAFAPKYSPYGLMGFGQTPSMEMYTRQMDNQSQESSQSRWQAGVDINRSPWGELGSVPNSMGGSRLFPGAGKLAGGMLDSYKEGGKAGYLERFARTVGSYIMKARGKDPYDSTPTAINGIRGYNGGMFRSYKDGGLFGKSVIDLSAGGKLPGTPSPGIDDAFATFATGGALVGKGEFFVPSNKIKGGDLANLNAINSRFAGNSTNGENANTSLYNTSRNAAGRSRESFKLGSGFIMNRGGTEYGEEGLNKLLAGDGGKLESLASGMNKNGGMLDMFSNGTQDSGWGGKAAGWATTITVAKVTDMIVNSLTKIPKLKLKLTKKSIEEVAAFYAPKVVKASRFAKLAKFAKYGKVAAGIGKLPAWAMLEEQVEGIGSGLISKNATESMGKAESLFDESRGLYSSGLEKMKQGDTGIAYGVWDIAKSVLKFGKMTGVIVGGYANLPFTQEQALRDVRNSGNRKISKMTQLREQKNFQRAINEAKAQKVNSDHFFANETLKDYGTYRDLKHVFQKDASLLGSVKFKYDPSFSQDVNQKMYETQLIKAGMERVKKMKDTTSKDVFDRRQKINDIKYDKTTAIVRRDDLLVGRYGALAKEKVNTQYPYLSDQDKKWAEEVLVEEKIASESQRKLSGVNKNLQYSEYYRQKGNEKTAEVYAKRAQKAIGKLGLSNEERDSVWAASSTKARENQFRVAHDKEMRDPKYLAGLEDVGMQMLKETALRDGKTLEEFNASLKKDFGMPPQLSLDPLIRNINVPKGPANQLETVGSFEAPTAPSERDLQLQSRRGRSMTSSGVDAGAVGRFSSRDLQLQSRRRRQGLDGGSFGIPMMSSFESGGQLTAGSIAGLATLTRMANGGQTSQQQAATAAMYLGGGINVQRMYLNGRLMASDAKSQGNDQFFSKLKLQTTG